MNVDFLTEPGSGSVNEDQILMADPVFGVFDGATSLNKYVDESGKTGGLLASTIAKETFKKETESLLALATEANESILHAMRKKGVDTGDKQKLWATSAAVVRIVDKEVEWLTVSDSIIMVFDTNGRHTLLGEFKNHDVVSLKLWKEHAEQRIEKISEKLTDVMIENRRRLNIDYGALDGEPGFVHFVQRGTLPLENIAHIVLATDGLFVPTENPEDEGWDQFAALYLEGGLKRIRDFVREREQSDPKCWRYPRFKVHDDIGAIALRLPELQESIRRQNTKRKR
jgi:serine/threonine protein phosphatase PrpC